MLVRSFVLLITLVLTRVSLQEEENPLVLEKSDELCDDDLDWKVDRTKLASIVDLDAPELPETQDYCTGQSDDTGDGFANKEDCAKTEENLYTQYPDLHAGTTTLKEGTWCITISHNGHVGPRLLAILSFLSDDHVVYSLVRSTAPTDEVLSEPQRINVCVKAQTPFTIHYIFVPGLEEVRKDNIEMLPGPCNADVTCVELKESNAQRLLTCKFQGEDHVPKCRWYRQKTGNEEDVVGADVAQWVDEFGDDIPAIEADHVSPSECEPFFDTWTFDDAELKKPRNVLMSELLSLRSTPGCLRVWLYGWGKTPENVKVYLQEERSENWEASYHVMKLPQGRVVTWHEEHYKVDFGQPFKVIVEFLGSLKWTGSLIVDDISAEDQLCDTSASTNFVLPVTYDASAM